MQPIKTIPITLLLMTLVMMIDQNMMSPVVAAQENSVPLTIRATVPNEKVSSGQDCFINLVLTNISQSKIALNRTNGENASHLDYDFKGMSDHGQSMAFIEPPDLASGTSRHPKYSSSRFKHLDLNESFRDTVNLKYVFDLSKPGIYKITVSKKFKGGIATSNEVSIQVVAP